MTSKTIATVFIVIALAALIAGCSEKQYAAPAASSQAAPDVPEITQAEQSVEEIGTSDLNELESDTDELILD